MDYPLCERFGWDAIRIQDRLRLLELDDAATMRKGQALQDKVIAPNIGGIIDGIYSSLDGIEEFRRATEKPETRVRLRERQKHYLLGLGIRFDEPAYFEERLRIGAVHQGAGVPQSLYQCTFQGLQALLIDHIPEQIREDDGAFEAMLRFILKITALDMSLAVDSYYMAGISDLAQSLDDERDKIARLHKLAVTDWLTSLHNHSYSKRCVAAALERASAEQRPLCVVMADFDHFKEINDAHGHLVGDDVLRIAAARMLSAARTGDVICRYGGEEFLFVLENTGRREAQDVAERVRARISDDAMHSHDTRLTLTISLGIARARPNDTVESLIDRADQALYAAKRAGRNCVRVASNAGLSDDASVLTDLVP